MVLYGPPGTGKTSIAQDLAAALKWTFIEITPSDFVANGESAVELRAREIFAALEEQERTVILLDEIDRLILNRESKQYEKQGDMFQVMTPGMLPKLKDLKSKNRSIFIIATNYKERIDPAAIRIGRIDKPYLVCLPNKVARGNILATELNDEIAKNRRSIPDSKTTAGPEIFGPTDVGHVSDLTVRWTPEIGRPDKVWFPGAETTESGEWAYDAEAAGVWGGVQGQGGLGGGPG
jgi:SpoVK/Ycf46/Vps4 family AAA+-type ATPase